MSAIIFKRAPLALLLIVFMADAGQRTGPSSNIAGRVILSSGDVLELLYSTVNLTETTLTMRDGSSGIVMTLVEKIDYVWNRCEAKISDGKTTLEVRVDLGYAVENLPVPVEIKIGNEIHRALLKANSLTDDQKKMRAAVGKLPAAFLAGLKHLVPIGVSPAFGAVSPNFLPELMEGALANVTITSTTKLEPGEIDALVRDSAR